MPDMAPARDGEQQLELFPVRRRSRAAGKEMRRRITRKRITAAKAPVRGKIRRKRKKGKRQQITGELIAYAALVTFIFLLFI